MKISTLTTVVAIILASLAFIFAFESRRETEALKKQFAQVSATTSFTLQSLDSGKTAYDSVIFVNDTAFFYKKGKFQGKTYTSTEEGTIYSISKEAAALKNILGKKAKN